jgi:hypothetical protein
VTPEQHGMELISLKQNKKTIQITKDIVFWVVIRCILAGICGNFGEAHYLLIPGRNVLRD